MSTNSQDPVFSILPRVITGGIEDDEGVVRDVTLHVEVPEHEDSSQHTTLTKREYFATEILKTMLTGNDYVSLSQEEVCDSAIAYADVLITRLNNV